jgi:uncharacterized OsmC-like protein
MSTTTPAPTVRNGIDTGVLFATLDAVKATPEIARFRFRAANSWLGGAHNRNLVQGFYAAGGEDASRDEPFVIDAGEPPILVGSNEGPNPAEILLSALASCLTTSIAYVAAARKVTLTHLSSTFEGDIDLRGALGLSDEVRNGYERIRAVFTIRGEATPEKLREVVERGRARSAVYDVVARSVPVTIDVVTA